MEKIITFYKTYKRSITLGALGILALSIPVILSQVMKQQDIRQRASAGDPVTLSLSPLTGNKQIGDEFDVQLKINTNTNDISAIDGYIRYDDTRLQLISKTAGSPYSEIYGTLIDKIGTTGGHTKEQRITLYNQTSSVVTGPEKVLVTFRFKALANGTAGVTFGVPPEGELKIAASGFAGNVPINNDSSSTHSSFTIGTVTATPTPTPDPTTCTTSPCGPKSPTLSVSTLPGVEIWDNPSNANLNDDQRTTSMRRTAGPDGTLSQALKSTGFGFSVPSNATITGIKVEVEAQGHIALKTPYAFLVIGGEIKTLGERSISNTNLTSTDTYYAYGSSTDLWNSTLTSSIINSPDFGVAMHCALPSSGIPMSSGCSIDHVRATVYFTVPPTSTTPTPTPSTTPSPTPCPAGASCPTPTPTPTPTNTPTPTATPTLAPGETRITISFSLPGIGVDSNPRILMNNNPKNKTRSASIRIFDLNGVEIGTAKLGNITFSSTDNRYKGSVSLGTTGIAAGTNPYVIFVKLNNSLWKRIGVKNITKGSENDFSAASVALITGDIDGDGKLTAGDYTAMLGCVLQPPNNTPKDPSCDTAKKGKADLNDDDKIDEKDIAILLSGFVDREGDL